MDLPYIFDRFYKVENSCAEFTGGSGLWLAISKSRSLGIDVELANIKESN